MHVISTANGAKNAFCTLAANQTHWSVINTAKLFLSCLSYNLLSTNMALDEDVITFSMPGIKDEHGPVFR